MPSPPPTSTARDGFNSEYPFESQTLSLSGMAYRYLDEGGPRQTSGTSADAPRGPLLFVHGNPTWSFAWRKLVLGLRDQRRCIAVDHMGCGLSDKPQEYGYTLAQHVENLCALVTALDLRDITLVAHDWGGCIGMGAAARLPDRFSRFVLMNTAAFRSSRIPARIAVCRIPVLGAWGVRGLNLFARAALRMAVRRRRSMSPAARRGYLAPYDSWAHRIAIHRFVQDIPLSPAHPSYAELVRIEESLAQFADRPMLLAWGLRDWCFTPAFLAEWEQRFPNAEVRRFPDASHYLFEDAPGELLDCLREFVSR